MKKKPVLQVATCQFSTTSSIKRNALQARRQIRTAAGKGAHVVHFPEGALSGYAGQDFASWEEFDWDALAHETERILAEARRARLWVILGSAHRLTGTHLPHNSLYVIDPKGRIAERYDKRFCTTGDLEYYSPGGHLSVVEIRGIQCGFLICYDVRFPELYRKYKQLGVQCLFHSFWNARATGENIHTAIMRPSLQARAATNAMWVSASNASNPFQSWPGVFITPDGRIERSLPSHRGAVMVNEVDPNNTYYDAAGPYRERAMKGVLHSGRHVNDARSKDRHSV